VNPLIYPFYAEELKSTALVHFLISFAGNASREYLPALQCECPVFNFFGQKGIMVKKALIGHSIEPIPRN
jgi:hypothetical protein